MLRLGASWLPVFWLVDGTLLQVRRPLRERQEGQAVGAIQYDRRRLASPRLTSRGRWPATDNGAAYKSRRFTKLLRRLKIKHLRTRPYTPRTNGKAERFIQTLLREWAYAYRYPTSAHRSDELVPWMHHYNFHRPHSATNHLPPATRLGFDGNNVLRNYN